MPERSLCEACHYQSPTQICIECYSIEHRKILSRCQYHLRQIEAQKIQLQPCRNEGMERFASRSKLLANGIRMAIEEQDMEHWEILLERRAKILKTWEEERRAMDWKMKELDKAADLYIESSEQNLELLQEKLKPAREDSWGAQVNLRAENAGVRSHNPSITASQSGCPLLARLAQSNSRSCDRLYGMENRLHAASYADAIKWNFEQRQL